MLLFGRSVFTIRTERYDWIRVAEELLARGLVHLESLLSEDECAGLRQLYAVDNALHRDVYGSVYFPLQCAVSLGPAGCENGGRFILMDERPGKRKRSREIATAMGDAVVFCTRDRLVSIAGVYGRQPVKHGVSPVTALRFALGIPFHEYASRIRRHVSTAIVAIPVLASSLGSV